jgi:hypothetical protein
MILELGIIIGVTSVGLVASLALLADSFVDRLLAKRAGEGRLVSVATQHIVSESTRVLVLAVFLIIAVGEVGERDLPTELVIWGLLAVPVLATLDGVYAWVWRRIQFRGLRDNEKLWHGFN